MITDVIKINDKPISLIRIGNANLTDAQKALLKILYKCLKKNISFNWEHMIDFYVKNVKSTQVITVFTGVWNEYNRAVYKSKTVSIIKEYKNNTTTWSYYIKPRIRMWFANNIGSMVLKGSILALPVIEIN